MLNIKGEGNRYSHQPTRHEMVTRWQKSGQETPKKWHLKLRQAIYCPPNCPQHTLTRSLLPRPLHSIPLAVAGVVSGCFSAPHLEPGPGYPLLTVIRSLPWQSKKTKQQQPGTFCIHSAICISHRDVFAPEIWSISVWTFFLYCFVLLEMTSLDFIQSEPPISLESRQIHVRREEQINRV